MPYDAEVRVAILIAGVPLVLGLVNTALVGGVPGASADGPRGDRRRRRARRRASSRCSWWSALDLGFYAVVATAAVGALVPLARHAGGCRARSARAPAGRARVWRGLLVAALPVGAALAVTELYFRADTLIISLFRPSTRSACTRSRYRIFELLAILPAIVMTSVFPLLSRYLAESRELAARTLRCGGATCSSRSASPLAAGGARARARARASWSAATSSRARPTRCGSSCSRGRWRS